MYSPKTPQVRTTWLCKFIGIGQLPLIAEAVAARLERSRILHEAGHRFSMVIEEPALYYRLGDNDAMAAQLGYLLTAGALPSVSLGIIPSATPERPMWPQELFHVYDDALVGGAACGTHTGHPAL